MEDPGLPELVPVFPLLDPVFPPGPVSIPFPGFAFSGNVPSGPVSGLVLPLLPLKPLSSLLEPTSALPGSPIDPPPFPPGAAVLCAMSMESVIKSAGAVLAADA